MSFTEETAKKVREEFDRKRREAQDASDARRDIVHARLPEIEAIDKELANTGLEVYRRALGGENIDAMISEMKLRTTQLRAIRARILRENGYAEDFTDVKYECPICSDTGYDGLNHCECFRRAMIKEAYLGSGLGGMLAAQSFDNFSLEYYSDEKNDKGVSMRDTMRTILTAAKKYAQSFGLESGGECRNLLFFGSTGLGKTHISTSIAKVVIEKGYSVVYDTASNILGAFESEKFSRSKEKESPTEKYLKCDLLIIDDLGAEFHNQYTQSALFNLLNTRICAGLPMIVSTNLADGSALERTYSDRLTSRLVGEFRAFKFVGSDIRLAKRRAGMQ